MDEPRRSSRRRAASSSSVTSSRASNSSRGSSNTSGSRNTTGSRPGLRRCVRKSLAKDIERNGGIASLKRKGKHLQRLLDKDVETYGPTGSALRVQIGRYVDKWKNYTKDQYLSRVLLKLKIDPDNLSSDSELSDSTDSDTAPPIPTEVATSIKKTPARASTKGKKGKGKAPSPIGESSPVHSAEPYIFSPSKATRKEDSQQKQLKKMSNKTYTINVSPSKAEDNGPFTVLDLGQVMEGVEGDEKGRLFYGYTIAHKMDIRHVVDNQDRQMYKARVSGENEILATVPAWDYNLLHNRDLFQAEAKCDNKIVDGIDNAIDSFEKMKAEREFRHYRLVFPEDFKLSSKTIYSGAGQDEWLELKIVPCDWQHQASGLQAKDFYVMWNVVNRTQGSRKKGKSSQSTGVSDAAAQLAGLGITGASSTSVVVATGNKTSGSKGAKRTAGGANLDDGMTTT